MVSCRGATLESSIPRHSVVFVRVTDVDSQQTNAGDAATRALSRNWSSSWSCANTEEVPDVAVRSDRRRERSYYRYRAVDFACDDDDWKLVLLDLYRDLSVVVAATFQNFSLSLLTGRYRLDRGIAGSSARRKHDLSSKTLLLAALFNGV